MKEIIKNSDTEIFIQHVKNDVAVDLTDKTITASFTRCDYPFDTFSGTASIVNAAGGLFKVTVPDTVTTNSTLGLYRASFSIDDNKQSEIVLLKADGERLFTKKEDTTFYFIMHKDALLPLGTTYEVWDFETFENSSSFTYDEIGENSVITFTIDAISKIKGSGVTVTDGLKGLFSVDLTASDLADLSGTYEYVIDITANGKDYQFKNFITVLGA